MSTPSGDQPPFDPNQSPYGSQPPPTFEPPPAYGPPPSYGYPPPPPAPYGQPYPPGMPDYPYPPGMPGYPYPPGMPGYPQMPPGPFVYVPPAHPQSMTALILGIVGLLCCALASPFAIWLGQKSMREIDASGGQLGGRGQAQAGLILGIVGVAIWVLGFILYSVLAGIVVSSRPAV